MHKLQVFVAELYVLPLSSVFQSIVYVEPLCLIFQMCVLNVVSVLYFSFLKILRWFPYLCLNGGAVSPTYFSTFCVFSIVVSVTVAWYIRFSETHLARLQTTQHTYTSSCQKYEVRCGASPSSCEDEYLYGLD